MDNDNISEISEISQSVELKKSSNNNDSDYSEDENHDEDDDSTMSLLDMFLTKPLHQFKAYLQKAQANGLTDNYLIENYTKS